MLHTRCATEIKIAQFVHIRKLNYFRLMCNKMKVDSYRHNATRIPRSGLVKLFTGKNRARKIFSI